MLPLLLALSVELCGAAFQSVCVSRPPAGKAWNRPGSPVKYSHAWPEGPDNAFDMKRGMFLAPCRGTFLVTASVEGKGREGGGRKRRRGYWLGILGERSHPYKNLKIGTVPGMTSLSLQLELEAGSSLYLSQDKGALPASQVLFCISLINREEAPIRTTRMPQDQEKLYETWKRDQEQAVMHLKRLIESTEEDHKHQLHEVHNQLQHFKNEQQNNWTQMAEEIMKEKEKTAYVRNQLVSIQTKFVELTQRQYPDVTKTLNDFQKRFYSHEQRQNGILENLNGLIETEKVETEKREHVEKRLRVLEQAVTRDKETARGSTGKEVRQKASPWELTVDLAVYDGGFGNRDDEQAGEGDFAYNGKMQEKPEDIDVYDGGFGEGNNDIGEVDYIYDGGY